MSYNYEINYNIQNKKCDISKYKCNTNESNNNTYIFELILKNNLKQSHIIRMIKNSNQGNLISSNDNILYNTINKYKLTVLDVKNPNNPIIIKDFIDHSLSSNIFYNNNIYLEINQTTNNYININYHLTNI